MLIFLCVMKDLAEALNDDNKEPLGGAEYEHFISIIVMYCFEQHVLHSLVVRIALCDVSASSGRKSSSAKDKT